MQGTLPGSSTIAGVQGRYFLPILPMLLLLLGQLKIQIPKFGQYDKIFGISCIFLNALSLLYVMIYFM